MSLLLLIFYTPASIFYLNSARERFTGHFLISNISTGNMPLSHWQQVQLACSKVCILLTTQSTESWVESHSMHGLWLQFFCEYILLWKQKPCKTLIPDPSKPTKCCWEDTLATMHQFTEGNMNITFKCKVTQNTKKLVNGEGCNFKKVCFFNISWILLLTFWLKNQINPLTKHF